MFIAALVTIAKTWKQPNCPSTEEWIKKMWYIYIHISNMEIITLSEVIRERDKYHRVSLICGILKKKMIPVNLFTKQK